MNNNPAYRTLFAWSIITSLAILGIFLPFILGIEGFSGGFAISFICFFLVIVGIIVIIIFALRAKRLARILRGEGVLAHWTYSSDKWKAYAEKEYKTEKGEKKALLIIISVIALVIGIIFFLINPQSGAWVLLVMVALIGILAFMAWFTSWYNHRENLKYHGEAYIADKAVYLNRQLHMWGGIGEKLENVELVKDGDLPLLVITYSVPTRSGRSSTSVRIPVPPGKENEAEGIAAGMKFEVGRA
jgi:hypothetical protein